MRTTTVPSGRSGHHAQRPRVRCVREFPRKVVKVLRKGKSKPWKPNNSSPRANTSRAKAKRVAVRHIERRTGQQARATWSGRENDNGAQWEIEVTTGTAASSMCT